MLVEDLITETLETLPPLERMFVRRVYMDGDSEFIVAREFRMKRKVVRAGLAAGVDALRLALRIRGVNGVADVL
jgi:DNA-directed RNA polymerase specialized sigma24 family protein